MSRMAARQSLISTWRWALETFGDFLASRPALVRRLVVNAFVLMAGVLLMLARTSPALAADNSHGQGKSQDRTSASAVVQRTDSPGHKSDHQIGGSGDGNNNKAKGGSSSQPAPKAASAPAPDTFRNLRRETRAILFPPIYVIRPGEPMWNCKWIRRAKQACVGFAGRLGRSP